MIFDFDGVLIDSPAASMKRVCQAAEFCQVKVPDQPTLKKCWAQAWENIIPNLAGALA